MEDDVKYDDETMEESKESRANSDDAMSESPLIVAEGAAGLQSHPREEINTSVDESNLNQNSSHCSSPTRAKDDVEMVEEPTETPPPREMKSSGNKEGVCPSVNGPPDDDKEEGELEEGELEDEGGEEPVEEKKTQESNEREQNKENKESLKFENKDTAWDKAEVKEKKSKDERKRKHKDFDEEKKKKKKRKHQYSSEEEDAAPKFPSGREKAYDFDTLLKQEMYLVGSGPNLEEEPSPEEDQYRGPSFQAHPQFKGLNDAESYESASGEEWDDNPRRRLKRKRRSSRSPSRKNEAICMFYLQGSCKRGSECPYSHEIAPTRKMELCKFYLMDCCAKKEKCLYMHKDFPCKYFHFGMKCKAGELCKFSHDPLRDITRNILLKHIELAPKDILGDFPRVSKVNAQIILGVTEAKRRGDPVDSDGLDNVLDLEGKGFKYLDRVLKSVRKRKGGDKKGAKDREKDREDKERSPKKSKNRDDYRDCEKDRDREKDGMIGRDRERDRPKDRERDRDRNRERGKHRSKGDYPPHVSQKQRDFSQRMDVSHQQGPMDEPRNRDSQGRLSFDQRASPSGGPNHMDPSMKWYSSDEEGEGTQGFRRGQNYSSHERRNRSSEVPSQGSGFKAPGLQQGHTAVSQHFIPSSFSSKSNNLDNIDVSYLKNVLNTVQSQSSQNSHPSGVRSHGDEDVRRKSSSSWGEDSLPLKPPLREGRTRGISNYMDMTNDIKEVFYDAPEPPDDISRRVDSLIQSARGRPSDQELREDRSFTGLRDSFQGLNEPSWNQGPNSRREDSMDSREFCPQGYRGETNDDRGFARGSRYLGDGFNSWKGKRERGSLDSREEGETKYVDKGEFEYSEGMRSKEDTDLRLLHTIAGGRIVPTLGEGIESKGNNRSPGSTTNQADRPANSIYDFDLRQLETRKISVDSEEELGSLPFKVPMHSAKEIDASINPRIPIYYQHILVDIPKPDFSRLKVNPDDPKTMEDPRLRKMLRRNSAEDSPTSPRASKLDSEGAIGSPTLENLKLSDSDNRDPRRMASRDPRAESKTLARMDTRVDPRLANRSDPRTDPRSDPRMETRGDPRGINPRFDPRVDNRDPRMDPREPTMDSDLREADPRICATPVFVNGMIEGSNYGHFSNINVASIDPRGRPGLLGPAPNQGPKNIPIGLPSPITPNMGANPFLISQGIPGGGNTPYLPSDRGDMMNASGSTFPQGKWGPNRGNFNDPRLGRDSDAASFTPSSIS